MTAVEPELTWVRLTSGHRLGVVVLSLKEGDRLLGFLVFQPGVLVGERVAVVGALGRDLPCLREPWALAGWATWPFAMAISASTRK